jgi:MscS family membrane protein
MEQAESCALGATACGAVDMAGRPALKPTMHTRFFRQFLWAVTLLFLSAASVPPTVAQEPAPPTASTPTSADSQQPTLTTQAAAPNQLAKAAPNALRPPDFLEHLVDSVLALFDVKNSGNTATHYVVAALFLAMAYLLRRAVTTFLFGFLRRLAAKTETTLDDKLFPALEAPVASLIVVTGALGALKVLKLSETSDLTVGYVSTMAYALVLFWLLLRAFNTLLDHLQEVATERQMGIAAFMPWIKKALVTLFVIFGVLMVAQSLGADVKAFLAGLGIGGLAFALAAQDTIANLFGSIVVAIDQPFKLGDTVKIGGNTGAVEDIGLRSTKLRLLDKSLLIVPNKTMASDVVTNLSRFTQRRTEQIIGLTYDTTPEQMENIVEDFRALITAEPDVEAESVQVFFRDYAASSLDIWIVYVTKNPDLNLHLATRQRINLALMRAVAARGLAFAFPTQTVQLDGPVAKQLVERKG